MIYGIFNSYMKQYILILIRIFCLQSCVVTKLTLLLIQTIKSILLNENTRHISNLVFFIYTKLWMVKHKYIRTATFIKRVLAHTLRDIEISTIERKMSHTESKCRIKLDGKIG